MERMKINFNLMLVLLSVLSVSCEVIDNDMDEHVDNRKDSVYVDLEDVASILAQIPLEGTHVREVFGAVKSSSCNGYDEEYTMRDIFETPGAGVGDKPTKAMKFENPLRDLIEQHVRSGVMTRSGGKLVDPDAFLDALTSSDIQIYWPFSEDWNEETFPVITFDPESDAQTNIGYKLVLNDDGSRRVEEIVVDEEMATLRPIWVVNRNSDAEFTSLEMLRREDPNWGEGGGTIIIEPDKSALLPQSKSDLFPQTKSDLFPQSKSDLFPQTKAGTGRSLILKDFTMNRQFDSWFAGGSEFAVRLGAVEDFTAVTEAEMALYNPSITDLMIVVKRNQMGKPQPFNAVLVSNWTDQMINCAFMITEDDGGTRTEWECTALVRVASKSYGVEMKLPFNSRDDIVWRGQLAGKWMEANSNLVGHFGDVDLTFEVMDY